VVLIQISTARRYATLNILEMTRDRYVFIMIVTYSIVSSTMTLIDFQGHFG